MCLTQREASQAAGLKSKTVTIDGNEVRYFEGGTGPTLVMLHRMADDRHSYVDTAAVLTDAYHIILPDLRVCGAVAPDPDLDSSIAGQAISAAAN